MRIATWNVNSMRARLDRVEEWLARVEPDVCCFQETKLSDEAFPTERFTALGYEVAHHGDGRWNGVAIASRIGLGDVERGFAGDEEVESAERRLITASCGPVRVMSVYVPNGRSVGSEHFQAKLDFLHRLRQHLDACCDPGAPVVVCGDFNVAPADIDVFDPAFFVGATHVTAEERSALGEVMGFGLRDVFRESLSEDWGAVHLVGLPGRRLPLRPRHAHRPRARDQACWPTMSLRRSSTGTPVRGSCLPTTPRRGRCRTPSGALASADAVEAAREHSAG